MRLSLRFILPLALVLGLVAYAVVPLVDTFTFRWFIRDIDIRTRLISSTLQESLVTTLEKPTPGKLERLFNRVIQDERLYGIALCNQTGRLSSQTATFPKDVQCTPHVAGETAVSRVLELPEGPLHVAFLPIEEGGKYCGRLVLVHDISFIQKRSADTRYYIIFLFAGLGLVISILTVFIAQMSWKGWVKGLRSALRGEGLLRPTSPISAIASPELQPIVKDLRGLIKDLESDRRTRDDDQGVLILSQFTGAARELPEALIVNPYNIDQCAAALHIALEMPRGEQISRMRSMRGLIQEFNVYRWAGRMLLDAASLRQRTRLFDRIEANRVRNFRVAP